MSETDKVSQVSGDGAKGAPDTLAEFKAIINDIKSECSDAMRTARRDLEKVVFCKWDGQRVDGRKRQDDLGEKPKPFEGASDNRVRLVDKIIREHVVDYLAGVRLAKKTFKPMEGMDQYAAAKLNILVKWITETYWGEQFITQLKLLGRYMEQDTPAVACAMVDWVEERRLEYRKIERKDLVDLFLEKQRQAEMQMEPEALAQMAETIVDMATFPELLAELEQFLQQVLDIKPARARTAARELQETGKTDIPVPYLYKRGPDLVALRLFDDVFIPANTTDPNNARVILRREWLSEPQFRERAIRLKWNKNFVAEMMGGDEATDSRRMKGQEGKSAFEDLTSDGRVNTTASETNFRKGNWEVITAYHYATNDDGVMGIYVQTFSGLCDTPATKDEPYKRKHGGMPFRWKKREELNDRLMDSRGVPELLSTDQQTFKLLRDSFEDYTQISTLPPITVPPGKPHYKIDLVPLGRVDSNSREPTAFMQPPPYPAGADRYWDKVRRDVNEDWGRADKDSDPGVVTLIKQDRVNTFLGLVSEILKTSVQLCQEFMPDDMFARIIGGNGVQVNRTVAEIQGLFDMSLIVDVNDMSLDGITAKTEIVLKNLRPLDTRSTIPYDMIIRNAVASLDPSWADAMPTVEQADQRETIEEKAAFIAMLNGVRPEMPESGINAPLRLQVLQGEIEPRRANPNAFPPLSQASTLLIQERMQYLEFQAAQMQNAITGRVGVDTKKTDEAMMGAGTGMMEGGAM